MGQFLGEAHKLRNLASEEKYLIDLEHNVDEYVEQVLSTEGEVLKIIKEPQIQQLQLFEEMAQYLTDTGLAKK